MAWRKETRAKGWWHAYGDVIPENFDLYLGLEEAASQISWYEPELVPGLLQTGDYARAITTADDGIESAEVERRGPAPHRAPSLIRRATAPLELARGPERVDLAASSRRPGSHGRPTRRTGRLSQPAQRLPAGVPFSAGRHHGIMTGPFEILRFLRSTATARTASHPPST